MMTSTPTAPLPPDIAALTFEDALAQLEQIVRGLESGQGKLDESIEAYQRGSFLRQHCEAKLKAAESRIEKISQGANGALTTQTAEF